MSVSQPAKFTFDLDLGTPVERSQTLSEDRLAQLRDEARTQGLQQGRIEGEQSAVARAETALATAAETIAGSAQSLLGELDASRKQLHAEAVFLARTTAQKLARHLVAAQPAKELDALIAESLATLEKAPHLVIRCHPDLAERLREIAEARIAASGFAGRLIVMAEDDIALGDGRLEWADGGLVRDMAAIGAEIDKRIAAYLEAEGEALPVQADEFEAPELESHDE